MRILFVWPSVTFSVWDVARGYRNALAKYYGEESIRDYYLHNRLAYHQKAIPPESQNEIILSKCASETVINEALYFKADHVIIVSGLSFHPIALWGLHRLGIKATAILTESPYNDEFQKDWAAPYPGMNIITTERISALQNPDWSYIPHAYDSTIHRPVPFNKEYECDVFMIGTGWIERQILLEQVDWTGIDLKLFGLWPNLDKSSVLYPFYRTQKMSLIDNEKLPERYASAKINLNIHRYHSTAQSLNPRAYEIAAIGGYQICDTRQEVGEVFGDSVPQVRSGIELEYEIRWALSHPEERMARAKESQRCVQKHTFDERIKTLIEILETQSVSQ